jgi:hypothetical protein
MPHDQHKLEIYTLSDVNHLVFLTDLAPSCNALHLTPRSFIGALYDPTVRDQPIDTSDALIFL